MAEAKIPRIAGWLPFGYSAIMSEKLSEEGDVVAAHIEATTVAFQIMVHCLQENGALERGQVPAAIHTFMEMIMSGDGDKNNMTLALLDDIRRSLLD